MSDPVKLKEPSYFEAKAAREAAARNSTPLRKACQWIVNNQIVGSLAALAAIHGYDFVTGGKSAMVHLQNQIPGDAQGRYMRGLNDVWYIMHWVVLFTLIRATVMYKILEPFVKWWGVRSARKITRFSEQGWLTIFYIVSSSAGLFVMSHEPHWMNTKHFWINYPEGHKQMSYLMKSYYLIQMGFWFQQIFVLLIEEPRKDFLVMGIHHIAWSLYANFVRIGNAVLVCMDVADIFLSGTKCLRYLGFENLAVGSFVVLMGSWMYTRHYLYGKILYSVYFESNAILDDSIFNPANGSGNLDDSRSDSEDGSDSDDGSHSSKKPATTKKNQ
ncbi:longevity assurance proteins LAG1/LAC1 [Linderina pennispora]|uniref:Longevity assurance proteins LAG1/LAC1 n=1 Tax=Linderina pennispora TaxID=61395 RepID=A0A1Y1WD52_9FUNG|nr:longevity assurance proteins LAG1/LAC1 [Linderina pennispora]ORX71477.1 longevity assurance proteins LAG1/LAC1 [Linderina pennispora]